ncbi:MAG: LEA type 2 family protein [Spirochaetales bacterium]|nr:LEA type 2 family protein [Spirochaetales bacterium]
MKKLLRKAVILLVVLGCTACETVEMLIQKPEVSVNSVQIQDISFNDITLNMELQVYNPNPVGIDLESFDYNLLIEENSLVKGLAGEGLALSAGGSSLINLPLTLSYEELYRSVSSLLDSDESEYRVDTGFNFLLPVLGEQRIELSHEGKIPNVRMPRFEFVNLYVKSLGLMGADLVILMNVENPNAFDVGLNKFTGALEVNNQNWAELSTLKAVDFPSKEQGEIGFQFRLEFLSMGRTVRDLLADQKALNYDFSGNISLDSSLDLMQEATLPLNISGSVDLVHPDTTGGEHSSLKIERSIEDNLINIFGLY